MNRDEGSYTLIHTYDLFFCHATSLPWQEPEEQEAQLSPRDRAMRRVN